MSISLSSDSGTLDWVNANLAGDATRRGGLKETQRAYITDHFHVIARALQLQLPSVPRLKPPVSLRQAGADLGSRALRNRATRRTTLSRRRHSALEYVLHFWSTTHFEIFTHTTKMISRAITRSLPRHALRPACRQFSSSSQRLAEAQAAEIKKLGVIGAGQMVRGVVQDIVKKLGLTRRKGSGYRSCCSQSSWCACHCPGQQPEVIGQGSCICRYVWRIPMHLS